MYQGIQQYFKVRHFRERYVATNMYMYGAINNIFSITACIWFDNKSHFFEDSKT